MVTPPPPALPPATPPKCPTPTPALDDLVIAAECSDFSKEIEVGVHARAELERLRDIERSYQEWLVSKDASVIFDSMAVRERRLREALEEIIKGAPNEKPEHYEGDNHGDSWSNGYDRARFGDAEIARAALEQGEARTGTNSSKSEVCRESPVTEPASPALLCPSCERRPSERETPVFGEFPPTELQAYRLVCKQAAEIASLKALVSPSPAPALPPVTCPTCGMDADDNTCPDDVHRVAHAQNALLSRDGWMCEAHPGTEWPHGDCAGPGMPWMVEGKDAVRALAASGQAASLREALEWMVKLCENANAGAFDNGNKAEGGMIDEGDVLAGRIIDRARAALSSPPPRTTEKTQ